MLQVLLQNATAILLQNVTEVYYKMRQGFYYKMRQFYYKMQLYNVFQTILLHQKNCYKSCLFHLHHFKLGTTYLWILVT